MLFLDRKFEDVVLSPLSSVFEHIDGSILVSFGLHNGD